MLSDDSESIGSDELARSDDATENSPSNSFGLPTTKTVLSDHLQFETIEYPSMKGFTNGFTAAI